MKGLLIDLDDTLYDYAPAERHARDVTLETLAGELSLPRAAVEDRYEEARACVKARLGERGAAHSRLLYFVELVHLAGRADMLGRVRAWERLFWTEYVGVAELRPCARDLLSGFRAAGGRVAIVTDLVVEVQLFKLEALGLLELIDAIAVSEEVPYDKPATAIFDLAIARLGVSVDACVVVGDSDSKDGGGARSLGVPFYLAKSSERAGGMSFFELASALGISA